MGYIERGEEVKAKRWEAGRMVSSLGKRISFFGGNRV
jgi:hypothetical protein